MVLKKSLSATLGVLASFYAALLIIQARLLSWSDSLPTGNDVLHAALQRPDSKDRIRRRVGIVGTSESREQYRQISGNFPRVAYMEAESKFDAAFWTQRREHPVVYENTDNQGRPPPKQHQTPVDPPIDQSMCEYISEWQYTPRPTCNHIHEISLADGLLSKKAHVLGNGGWRVGLEYELPYDKIVFKTTIQRKRFDELTIHRHFVDAAVTDEMTHSSHSVRQYGYCSQAALNEFAPHTLRGYMKAKKKSGVVVPSSTKLNFLSQVAQGLVDLHYHPSHPDKVAAVYNDLKPSNIVLDFVDEVPLLKLSDFNDVKIVKWNTTSDSECHFRKLIWDKNNLSPEEILQTPLTSAVDSYAFGCLVYYMLTGEEPYLDEKKSDSSIERRTLNDIKPQLTESISLLNDPITVELIALMDDCWKPKPDERPTSRQIVARLKEIDEFHRNGRPTNILIGLTVSRETFPVRTKMVERTWANITPPNVFVRYFLGDSTDDIPSGSAEDLSRLALQAGVTDPSRIVVMKGVVDNEYPLVTKASAVIKHLQRIVEESDVHFDWILDVDDDTYLQMDGMLDFLAARNPKRHHYIGRRGFGFPEDKKSLREAGLTKPFCNGGPGFILSRPTLQVLARSIDTCQKDVEDSTQDKKRVYDDVLIGICINRELGIGCSDGSNYVKDRFINMFVGDPDNKWLTKGVASHAFKKPKEMEKQHERYMDIVGVPNPRQSDTFRRIKAYVTTLANVLPEHKPRMERFAANWNSLPLEYEINDALMLKEDGLGCSKSLLNAVEKAMKDGTKDFYLFLEDDAAPFEGVSAEQFEEQLSNTIHEWPRISPYLLLGGYWMCHSEDPNQGPEGKGGVTRIEVAMGSYSILMKKSFLPDFYRLLSAHIDRKISHYSPDAFLFRDKYFDDSRPAYVATPLLVDHSPGYSATLGFYRKDPYMGKPRWWEEPVDKDACTRGTFNIPECDVACRRSSVHHRAGGADLQNVE